MAFCNSCGATLNAGTKFCNKCGATVSAGPVAPSVASAPPPPAQPSTGGSSALKIILIVIAIIVGLGILSVGAFSFFVYRVAKSAHVTQNGDNVKVETPFGNVESSKDPAQAAKDLGIDIYPGAEIQKNGSASMTFGNMHTVSASFESSDSLDKVCAFYKSKFPNAMSTSSDQNRCNIVSNDQKNMVTVNIQANGDTTKFQITNVSKKSASSN
jgi:flagellar basal body-associated protein FliL